jgi:hypothetical protein
MVSYSQVIWFCIRVGNEEEVKSEEKLEGTMHKERQTQRMQSLASLALNP